MFSFLQWDSQFFQKKIVNISCNNDCTIKSLDENLQKAKIKKSDCVYIQIESTNSALREYCKKINIPLISIRTELVNNHLCPYPPNPSFMLTQNIYNQPSKLIPIVNQIAKTSRFYKDKKFRPFAFKLYDAWIHKSVSIQSKFPFFLTHENNKITGILTLEKHIDKLSIGLFGVEKKSQKKGIGTALVLSAISWAFENKFKSLSVSTQKENAKALSVYTKNGFTCYKEIYQYHLWI